MKRILRATPFAVIAALPLVVYGCASDVTGISTSSIRVPPVVAKIFIVAPTTLAIGSSAQATARAENGAGASMSGVAINWESSNTNIVTISPTGQIDAIAPGVAVISASAQSKWANASITVTPVPVASITVSLGAATVPAGNGVLAIATVRDATGKILTDRTVSWSSSNPSVATISSIGSISTLAPGSTEIQASTDGKTGTAMLTVR